MRRAGPRQTFFCTGFPHGRCAAQLLAVLTFVLSQVSVPISYVGTTDRIAAIDTTASGAGARAAIGHRHIDNENRSDFDAVWHSVCHFCRPDGMGLPPPPTMAVAVPSSPKILLSVARTSSSRPQEHFATGHPVRAPPARY